MTTPNSDSINLAYIEAAAQECLEFLDRLSFDQFFNDRKTRAAVVWQICIIGEAVNRLSAGIRQQAPEADWRNLIDMRNILIHGFHRINYGIVWHVAQEEIPPLITSVRRLLNDLGVAPC